MAKMHSYSDNWLTGQLVEWPDNWQLPQGSDALFLVAVIGYGDGVNLVGACSMLHGVLE